MAEDSLALKLELDLFMIVRQAIDLACLAFEQML